MKLQRVRVTCDGRAHAAQVVDVETGRAIDGVRRIVITIDVRQNLATAELFVDGVAVDCTVPVLHEVRLLAQQETSPPQRSARRARQGTARRVRLRHAGLTIGRWYYSLLFWQTTNRQWWWRRPSITRTDDVIRVCLGPLELVRVPDVGSAFAQLRRGRQEG